MRLSKLARRSLLRYLSLAAGLLTLTSAAHAQSGFSAEMQEALRQAAQRSPAQSVLTGPSVPLEGAVDPETYIVGPGDVFEVAAGTALPAALDLTVSADGVLVIPSTGSFPVAGLSLAEARRVILAGLRRTYRNVDSDVALARPRQFYVHVAGTVPSPGRHVVAPVARVEDALAASMEGSSPVLVLQELRRAAALTGEPVFLPALRSIEVRRRDGTTERVDLWRYYTSGDLRFNPYVRDGDALFVPAFRDDLASVAIEGEVPNPGSYDYRTGDTVRDLLLLASGAEGAEALGEVRLVRRGTAGAQTLDARAVVTGTAEDPPLQPGDRIIVRPRDLQAGTATIDGYVIYPGTYPIESGETTVRGLVERAGGLRSEALVYGAYIERRGSARSSVYDPDQPTPFRTVPLDADVNPQALEIAMDTEVSALSRNSGLGFSGRQFYARELLRPQRVSVDVGRALRGDAPPITLQDGDRLVIPRDPRAVLVVGEVEQPGYVPYEPGLTADDYVARAGGQGALASGVYVRAAATGRVAPSTERALQSGDYVFVDRVGVGDTPAVQTLVLQERNLEFQRERERAERRFRLIQTGAGLVGAVAAAVTAYVAVVSLNNQ